MGLCLLAGALFLPAGTALASSLRLAAFGDAGGLVPDLMDFYYNPAALLEVEEGTFIGDTQYLVDNRALEAVRPGIDLTHVESLSVAGRGVRVGLVMGPEWMRAKLANEPGGDPGVGAQNGANYESDTSGGSGTSGAGGGEPVRLAAVFLRQSERSELSLEEHQVDLWQAGNPHYLLDYDDQGQDLAQGVELAGARRFGGALDVGARYRILDYQFERTEKIHVDREADGAPVYRFDRVTSYEAAPWSASAGVNYWISDGLTIGGVLNAAREAGDINQEAAETGNEARKDRGTLSNGADSVELRANYRMRQGDNLRAYVEAWRDYRSDDLVNGADNSYRYKWRENRQGFAFGTGYLKQWTEAIRFFAGLRGRFYDWDLETETTGDALPFYQKQTMKGIVHTSVNIGVEADITESLTFRGGLVGEYIANAATRWFYGDNDGSDGDGTPPWSDVTSWAWSGGITPLDFSFGATYRIGEWAIDFTSGLALGSSSIEYTLWEDGKEFERGTQTRAGFFLNTSVRTRF